MSKPTTMVDRARLYCGAELPLLDGSERDFWPVHLAAFAASEVARATAELRRIWTNGTNEEMGAALRPRRRAKVVTDVNHKPVKRCPCDSASRLFCNNAPGKRTCACVCHEGNRGGLSALARDVKKGR